MSLWQIQSIGEIKMEQEIIDKMYKAALDMRNKSYSPYSNFAVGAVVLLKNNKLIGGCNIENSSYGLSMCAERNAIFRSIMDGARGNDIKAMLIVGDTPAPISPCGACRQVMSEFMDKDSEVIMADLRGNFLTKTVEELLPYSFGSGDLNV